MNWRSILFLVCWIRDHHNQRWSPDDADQYCRTCGKKLFEDEPINPNGGESK